MAPMTDAAPPDQDPDAAPDFAPDPTAVPAPKRRRPFGLMVLAGLLILKALILVTVVIGSVAENTLVREVLRLPRLVPGLRETPVAAGIILVVAGLLVLSASGLLAGKRAGWLLSMVLTGAFIAIDITAFLGGSANHFWMILNIVTVFYLNQAEVRAQFEVEEALGPDAAASAAAA